MTGLFLLIRVSSQKKVFIRIGMEGGNGTLKRYNQFSIFLSAVNNWLFVLK
jgi:hypothetical protein